jgi:alkanesulfonate monooxygenase SsuD/methylene tetrahydromethanopterin reductase-like flavin-dependent oxidoreductase (luciferase family)
MRRLEAACRTLPALWRGETVNEEALGLVGASVGPIGIEPPRLVVGGTSRDTMAIAARYAHGWNLSTPDPDGVRDGARATRARVRGPGQDADHRGGAGVRA